MRGVAMNEKQKELIRTYRDAVWCVFHAPNPVSHVYAVFLMGLTYSEARINGVWAYLLEKEYDAIEDLYARRN